MFYNSNQIFTYKFNANTATNKKISQHSAFTILYYDRADVCLYN